MERRPALCPTAAIAATCCAIPAPLSEPTDTTSTAVAIAAYATTAALAAKSAARSRCALRHVHGLVPRGQPVQRGVAPCQEARRTGSLDALLL